MEAAASGLPVVATDIRGCRQVVEDGVTGRLVPVDDPAALRAALVGLSRDGPARSEMGRQAVRKARADFDERRVVQRVMEAYASVARRRDIGLDPPPVIG
jgi:glycosyltransferase involved in cell wall biosynthesis